MGIILCQACCFVCIKCGCREKQHQPCATILSPNLTPASEQSWSTEIRRVGWGYCEYWCSSILLFLLFLFSTYILFLVFVCFALLLASSPLSLLQQDSLYRCQNPRVSQFSPSSAVSSILLILCSDPPCGWHNSHGDHSVPPLSWLRGSFQLT